MVINASSSHIIQSVFSGEPRGALVMKTNPVTEDYLISNNVLGLGISGKVVECVRKPGSKVNYSENYFLGAKKIVCSVTCHGGNDIFPTIPIPISNISFGGITP